MTQSRRQTRVVLATIAIFVGTLLWEQTGIADVDIRRQAVRASAALGLLIIVILSLHGFIVVITDRVKSDAPDLYGQVNNLGKLLFIGAAMSSGFVTSLAALLRGRHDPPYLEVFGVVVTAIAGGIAPFCWRYVWNACRILIVYKRVRDSRKLRS